MKFPREVVVITGASAGVGRAVARGYGARGASVGLIARGRDGLEAARREIEEAGGQALVCPADVAEPQQVEEAASAVESRFGPLDIWINNAMVSVFSPIMEMTPDEFKRVTDVTYLAKVGYAAQQTNEPEDANRANNLWSSLPGDHGARGRFDSAARTASAHLWLSRHRGAVAIGIGSVALWMAGRRVSRARRRA